MATFVALLRGVNVGKARRVPMVEFRALLEDLGFTSVATLLNSGNAVFRAARGTAARHAAEVSAAISARLHIEVPVVVKSALELTAIVDENPLVFSADDHSRLLVAFTQEASALSDLAVLESLVVPPEQFATGRHAAYLLCASGMLGSKAGEALLGRSGRRATTRNWGTVLKLQSLAKAADDGKR